ncbi:MAG: hypothetical protein GHCLOJNM_03291 [bacterium]|nr:hypothetical protein [bacterium]
MGHHRLESVYTGYIAMKRSLRLYAVWTSIGAIFGGGVILVRLALGDNYRDHGQFNEKTRLRIHSDRITDLAVSPDSIIYTSSWDGTVRSASASNLETVRTYKPLNDQIYINCVAIFRDSRRFASGADDGKIRIWRIEDESPFLEMRASEKWHITALDIDRDDTRMLSGDAGGTVSVWELPSGRRVSTQKLSDSGVKEARFVDGSHVAIIVFECGTICIFNLTTGSEVWRRGDLGINSVDCQIVSTRLVTSGQDSTVRLWDLHTGSILWEYAAMDGTSISCVRFLKSSDAILAACSIQRSFRSDIGVIATLNPGEENPIQYHMNASRPVERFELLESLPMAVFFSNAPVWKRFEIGLWELQTDPVEEF